MSHSDRLGRNPPHFARVAALIAMLFSLVLIFTFANKAQVQKTAKLSNRGKSDLAINSLQSWYDNQTGLYRTTGWWNSANAITTLADYSKAAHAKRFNSVFENTFEIAQKAHPAFINEYYDDEGWWALAWIEVYDQTHREQYLDMAESIFSDMTGGWSDTCKGGIWWNKERKYKNAIANELFLSVAAHLASRAASAQQRSSYLAWTNREWQWFAQSGMINNRHLVNDGLDAHCLNNGQTTWTYNQGVILGGLTDLYRTEKDQLILDEAQSIATAVLADPELVDKNGILHEPCEPTCDADGTQFKGIFVRNLGELDQMTPSQQFKSFILTNARSIWSGAHPPEYHLGLIWSAPYGKTDASTQSSAADALVAAMQLSGGR